MEEKLSRTTISVSLEVKNITRKNILVSHSFRYHLCF